MHLSDGSDGSQRVSRRIYFLRCRFLYIFLISNAGHGRRRLKSKPSKKVINVMVVYRWASVICPGPTSNQCRTSLSDLPGSPDMFSSTCTRACESGASQKHETLTQCWASVVDGGPTLGQCLVFAGIYLTL